MVAGDCKGGHTSRKLRIVIADDDLLTLRSLRYYVESFGHSVVAEACSGAELIDSVVHHRPDLVITDIILDGLDGLSAIKEFSQDHRCAIVVVSCCDDEPTLEHAGLCPVQAYIPKPINAAHLSAALTIAPRRFEELQKLREEAETATRRLADRTIVERAKGVLMKRAQVSEEEAYIKLRTLARNTGQTMGQIANSLLLTDEALSDLLAQPGDTSDATHPAQQ